MKYFSKQTLCCFLAQAALVGFCSAQTNDAKIVFRAADTNLDGKVTLDEFKQQAKQESFKNIDKNGDGKVDSNEWKAAAPSPQAESHFEAMDKDRDKNVSFLDFSERADKLYNYDEMFNSLDRNRDGNLSPDEYNARPAATIFMIKF